MDPTPEDIKAAEESEGAGFESRADRAAFLRGVLHERARAKRRAKPKSEPPGWLAFWAAYPRKVAKPAALRAFIALSPSDLVLVRMLGALTQQKESDQWSKDGGKYIPYPATWINQRRWEDDPGTGSTERRARVGLADGQRVPFDDSATAGGEAADGPGELG